MNVVESAKRAAYFVVDACYGFRGVPRLIDNERIRFPARLANFYGPSFQPKTSEFIRKHVRPGDTALDLGAHIGLFTLQLASAVGPTGRVVAFEPTNDNRCGIKRAVELNRLTNIVEVREEAIGGENGPAIFHLPESNYGVNGTLISTMHETEHSITIKTITLNAVADMEQRVSFVKMDIEGAELVALESGDVLLKVHRPIMAIDIHPQHIKSSGRKPLDVYTIMTSANYRVSAKPELFEGDDIFEFYAIPL
jgi:FkbM family methyltransferase